ncbi:hypothetical protein ENUP19_0002G0056 [Entamoeba nuttalli]|uniref:sn-1-specific diacylglycerol lipase n=2 Tax=Entamoeba nuttalli TaxID=412467 RepID=K2H183_ENTNP|nr:lipase, putative [Entamoeba nuttalli P19]EKE41298.1 lipase, putative [Entamoeba nuttalli P19]|eukprot:XP_008856366.1 lipase, putative [Entamoeba nuttalli P19]
MTYITENTYNYNIFSYKDIMNPKPVDLEIKREEKSEIQTISNTIDAFIELPGNKYSDIIPTYLKENNISLKDILLTIHQISKSKININERGIISQITDVHFVSTLFYYMRLCVLSYGKWVYIQGDKDDNIFKRAFTIQSSSEDVDWKLAQKLCGLDKTAFVKYQWTSEIFDPAYFIVVIDSLKTISVVIRGTFSLNDAKVDLCAKPVPYTFAGINGFTHAGIYKAALNKYQQIIPTLKMLRLKYPSFQITIAGHSLGGGVAQLLTLEINKNHPDWLVHGYCLAPALVLSLNIASSPLVRSLIDSVVSKNDIVPRLSFDSIKNIQPLINEFRSIYNNTSLISLNSKETTEQYQQAFNRFYESTNTIDPSVLVPPGRVFHIQKRKEQNIKKYCLYERENKEFGWLFIKVLSLSDHFPYNYYYALSQVVHEMTIE